MEDRGSQGSCSTPWNEPEYHESPNEKAGHQETINLESLPVISDPVHYGPSSRLPVEYAKPIKYHGARCNTAGKASINPAAQDHIY